MLKKAALFSRTLGSTQDMPEQDQWSGPRRFTAHRAKTTEVEKVAEVVGEVKEVVVEE